MTLWPRVSVAPRRMFPPPTTMASSTPRSATRDAWRAIRLTSSTLMPASPGRQKLSPESLSKTRRNRGGPYGEAASIIDSPSGPFGSIGRGSTRLADDEPGEPRDRDVLAGARVDLLDHVADRPG